MAALPLCARRRVLALLILAEKSLSLPVDDRHPDADGHRRPRTRSCWSSTRIEAQSDGGIDQREAACIDACRKRARPIVMTTVAMAAGMLPIALASATDAAFRAPMAMR